MPNPKDWAFFINIIGMDISTNEQNIFENIFKESKDNHPKFFDDLTFEDYYDLDKSGPDDENVYFENFVWNRGKSNSNIRNKREGKGFSFYYAALTFKDKYKYTVKDTGNKDHSNYDVTVGIVNEKEPIVVVNTKVENNLIRIVSSWISQSDSKFRNKYWKRRNIIINKQGLSESLKSNDYLLIRRAKELPFNDDSEGKVIHNSELDFPSNTDYGSYEGKRVFIQTRDTFKMCNVLKIAIHATNIHKGVGFDW